MTVISHLLNSSEMVDNAASININLHTAVTSNVADELRGRVVEHDENASLEVKETTELLILQRGLSLGGTQHDNNVVVVKFTILGNLEGI